MGIRNEFQPQYSIHPCRILLEEIKSRHLSQAEFAERTGMTTKQLKEIVNGKADITPKVAISVEADTGIPVAVWLNLQSKYDEVSSIWKRSEKKIEKEMI